MRQNAAHEGKVVLVDGYVDMEAFDRLPRRVRDAMNYANLKYSALEVEHVLEDEIEDDVLAVLV